MNELDHPGTGGNPPIIFDGDPTKAQEFMGNFCCYCMLNPSHLNLTTPFQRVIMCLTLIKGPKVADWVAKETNFMEEQLRRGADPNAPVAWDKFKEEFAKTFVLRESSPCCPCSESEPSVQENPMNHLVTLWMKQIQEANSAMMISTLEDYIEEFNILIELCHWDKDAKDTIWHFKNGLTRPLLFAVLREVRPRPITLEEWQEAMRVQQEQYVKRVAVCAAPKPRTLASRIGIHSYPYWKDKWQCSKKTSPCLYCEETSHLMKDCPQEEDRHLTVPPTRYHTLEVVKG
jgi:hypothetical protein